MEPCVIFKDYGKIVIRFQKGFKRLQMAEETTNFARLDIPPHLTLAFLIMDDPIKRNRASVYSGDTLVLQTEMVELGADIVPAVRATIKIDDIDSLTASVYVRPASSVSNIASVNRSQACD